MKIIINQRVSSFWSNNYIDYECSCDRKLVEEYLNKTRPYLIDIISNLKKSYSWKIQLTIAITLFLSYLMMKSV